jgi:hydrogenase maturation protease
MSSLLVNKAKVGGHDAARVSSLILGVGSPLRGDDALGILAVQRLRAHPHLPPGVDVIDGGTDGLGLVPVIEAYERVIIVDAVEMGLPAGTIRRLSWDEVRLIHQEGVLSLHQSGLADALLLAQALHVLPPELVIYGVQPHNTGWDEPVSESVERALPELIASLIDEVRSKCHDGKEEDSDY